MPVLSSATPAARLAAQNDSVRGPAQAGQRHAKVRHICHINRRSPGPQRSHASVPQPTRSGAATGSDGFAAGVGCSSAERPRYHTGMTELPPADTAPCPEALEDAADAVAARRALAEDAPWIPAEQVWAELGLDGGS